MSFNVIHWKIHIYKTYNIYMRGLRGLNMAHILLCGEGYVLKMAATFLYGSDTLYVEMADEDVWLALRVLAPP